MRWRLVLAGALTAIAAATAAAAAPTAPGLILSAEASARSAVGATVHLANDPALVFTSIQQDSRGWMVARGQLVGSGSDGSRAVQVIVAFRATPADLEDPTPAQNARIFTELSAAAVMAAAPRFSVPAAELRAAAAAIAGHWFSRPTLLRVDADAVTAATPQFIVPRVLALDFLGQAGINNPVLAGPASVGGIPATVIVAGPFTLDVSSVGRPQLLRVVERSNVVGSTAPPVEASFLWQASAPVRAPRAVEACAILTASAAAGLERIGARGLYSGCR